MYYERRALRKNGEDGISPVVGVMLMLVVTIIIAAVVSAFAGGAVTGSQKSPNANVEIHIRNGGTANTSFFSMTVLGVSEPIPTKNLKLYTSWQTTNKTDGVSTSEVLNGGGIANGTAAATVSGDLATSNRISVPTGYGNGVGNVSSDTYHTTEAQWGSFTLSSGTSTFDRPVSSASGSGGYGTTSRYLYRSDGSYNANLDPMQVILGQTWNNLRAGDTVSVRIVDVKSGKTIVDQNVVVEG